MSFLMGVILYPCTWIELRAFPRGIQRRRQLAGLPVREWNQTSPSGPEPTRAKTTAIMIPQEEIPGEKTDAGIEARFS
jgi:hypothetical protein